MLQQHDCVTHDMGKVNRCNSIFLGVSFLRHERISPRNTRFFYLPFDATKFSWIDIVSLVFFLTFHCMASCGYIKHHDDSPRQNVLVGVPCGPSLFNLGNVKCVAIASVAKMSRFTSCIVNRQRVDITLNSESTLLLTRAGREFPVRHSKS